MHFSRIHLLSPSAVWTCHPRWTCSKFRVHLTSKTEYYLTSQERCGCSPRSSPTRGPQDEKIKSRSCRNKAADSEGGRRPVPTRGNRRGDRAVEVERFGRAIFVTVQSIVGDRRPLDLLILNQCFLKLRRYGEIQSSLGLSKPLLAARLKKMVRLGVLKKVPSRESARVHEYLLTEKGRQL